MSQPFNQQIDEADVRAAQAAFPCPHTGGVDDDGYCLTCDRQAVGPDGQHTFIPKGTLPAPAMCRICGLSGFNDIHST